MLSKVTLDDNLGYSVVLHDDNVNGKRGLITALGLRGVQSLRTSKRVKPQAHGGLNETRYEDGRSITLTGEIISQISMEDAFAEWTLVAAAMIQTLDDGPALLKWTEGETGNQLQMLVKLDGDLLPPFQDGAAVLSYQCQLFAEDPRAYGQSLRQFSSTPLSAAGGGMTFPLTFPFTFASSGGGILAVKNAGNRSTPPVFRIHGMCVNPTIVLAGTGQRLVFNGTIDAGNYLEVDAAKRTVQLISGGVATNRLNFYNGSSSTWFELPGGAGGATSNLQLIAGSFDSQAGLDVLYRDAWS